MSASEATIVVLTTRPWFGNQGLGAFVISLDGKKAGTLRPQGSLTLTCPAGAHRVRARQWWYLSPWFDVTLTPGSEVELHVDLVSRGSALKRMLTLMFVPWRGVAISAFVSDA